MPTKTQLRVHSKKQPQQERWWRAIVERDASFAGEFFYAVRTTGIYCRPGCASRQPRRQNVEFFENVASAEARGFQPCRRCRPREHSVTDSGKELVVSACRLIEQSESLPRLEELAQSAGMSMSHFHRLFKAIVGMTPKAYANEVRNRRLRDNMSKGGTVAQVAYDAGFQSSSRFYASTKALGMKPATFRRGGAGMTIRFAVGECTLGSFLVAATEQGVCAMLLGDEPEPLIHDLERRFPNAELIGGDAEFEKTVSCVLSFLDDSIRTFDLPLDIRGTVFQQKVWRALQQIPPGTTSTYTELAQQMGAPTAIRAVAQACAANPVAVAIPCHRVISRDGSLTGYRWGIERKAELLKREGESLVYRRSN